MVKYSVSMESEEMSNVELSRKLASHLIIKAMSNGGCTLYNGDAQPARYVYSLHGHEVNFGLVSDTMAMRRAHERISRIIKHDLDNGLCPPAYGTWIDPIGALVFDYSVPTDSLELATMGAILNQQHSIYDSELDVSLPVLDALELVVTAHRDNVSKLLPLFAMAKENKS